MVYSWGRNLLTAEEWEAQRISLLAAEEEAERVKEREEAARESKDSGAVVAGKYNSNSGSRDSTRVE